MVVKIIHETGNRFKIHKLFRRRKEITYGHAFASDAVHDAERRAQIRMPRLFQLVDLFAEITIYRKTKKTLY